MDRCNQSKLVPEEGLEPTRPCGHRILSPARLPVPPLRRGGGFQRSTSSRLRSRRATLGFGVKFFRLDYSAVHIAAADDDICRTRFHFENKKASSLLYKTRGSADSRSRCQRLQMIHFDSRAYGDRSGRQFGKNRLCCCVFHHADHCGRRKNCGQTRIEMRECPLVGNDSLDGRLQSQARLAVQDRASGRRHGRSLLPHGTHLCMAFAGRCAALHRDGSRPGVRGRMRSRRGSKKLRENSAMVIPSWFHSLCFKLR